MAVAFGKLFQGLLERRQDLALRRAELLPEDAVDFTAALQFRYARIAEAVGGRARLLHVRRKDDPMLRRRVFHFAVALVLAVTAQAYSWSNTYGQCYIYCNSGMVAIPTSLEECCGNCTTYLQCPDGSGGVFGHSWFPDPGSPGDVTLCQAC